MDIIHIDMDAFFASIEQRDNPSLKCKPVAVGGRPEQRGVIAAASYEARKFGVKSAMPSFTALKLCPGLILLPVNHTRYRQVSSQLMNIFKSFTPVVEPISLDEAFLDVRGCEKLFGSAVKIGRTIQEHIETELHLTASVGIGPNKFIAKLASDYCKPHGFTVVPPNKVDSFLIPMKVEKIWGVGSKAVEQLRRLGVVTIGQLRKIPAGTLEKTFGKYGLTLYKLSRGIDDRVVESNREVKSIGKEITFAHDIRDMEELCRTLCKLADIVSQRLRRNKIKCGSVTLKIKYHDHRLITRTERLPEVTDLKGPIYTAAVSMLYKYCVPPVRLIGIACGKLTDKAVSSLFPDENLIKEEKVTRVIDILREKYDENVVTVASLLKNSESN